MTASFTPTVVSLDDRSEGYPTDLPIDATPCDLTLTFEPGVAGGPLMLSIVAGPTLASRFVACKGPIPLALSDSLLAGAVVECQAVWWQQVVETRVLWGRFPKREHRPYMANANEAVTSSQFARVCAEIALAGQTLFNRLFRPDNEGHDLLRSAGQVLRDTLLEEEGLRILVQSSDEKVQAPWNFIYLGRDPDTPDFTQFLGYRHRVEHDFRRAPLAETAMPFPTELALHLDENIDEHTDLKKFEAIKRIKELLGRRVPVARLRADKRSFLRGLRAGAKESVFYFLCHGEAGDDTRMGAETARLYLTQEAGIEPELRESITPGEVLSSLDIPGPLEGRPIVFINACRATRTGSIFYAGFAARFLNRNARAVIGPEIEMPVVFARDFAEAFFERFLAGGPARSVGNVLFDLRRSYLREHRNPLGLAYSLYRGGGVYIEPLTVLPSPNG